MAIQSPFSALEGLLQNFPLPAPPEWARVEAQRRIVSLLNHILKQEPEACARLRRQQGRVVQFVWRSVSLRLVATPAGLLDLAAAAVADLCLSFTQEAPLELAQTVLRGDKPAVRIEGDVQLAAEVNWLIDHVRWDLEEDLSRLIGDGPAHALAQAAQVWGSALRQFLGLATTAQPESHKAAP